jgi:type II secretory pathway pseudopilin PulG
MRLLKRVLEYNMNKQKNAGFTLVDMSIMLAVVAAGIAMLLSSFSVKKQERDMGVTSDHRVEIQAALDSYFTQNGYYPCPASGSVAFGSASFGRATSCSAAAVAGVSDPAVPAGYAATDAMRIGVVPVRTLQLPDDYMFDGWGNRITYAVIKNLAKDSATYTAYTTAVTTGVIQILDSSSTQVTPTSTSTVVAYTLVSHGKNGLGAYTRKGITGGACSTTALDKENCDNDYVFIDTAIDDTAQGAAYYDDVLAYKTRLY